MNNPLSNFDNTIWQALIVRMCLANGLPDHERETLVGQCTVHTTARATDATFEFQQRVGPPRSVLCWAGGEKLQLFG